MFNVEQFIYTAASIENKKGYQIVAKSEGVTEKIVSELESYVYPINADPSKFKESISLIPLKNDLIAYSRIKNVGLGYDGRENTLYNHTFIFSKNDFEKYNCDSRIFDNFYLENKSIHGILPTLSIDPPKIPILFQNDELDLVLEEILFSLFTNQKIALLFDDVKLPQNIMTLLPKSMRLIAFSTFVVEPTKQPKYHFILNSKLNKSKIKKNFKLISPKKSKTFSNKTPFENSISYYAKLIRLQKFEELKEIQQSFENIPGKHIKNKLILLCNYSQFQLTTDEEKRSYHAGNTLEILKQFDQNTFSHYFEKIKDSLNQYKELKTKLESEINPSMSFLENLFFMPAKIMVDMYNAFLEPQKQKNNED